MIKHEWSDELFNIRTRQQLLHLLSAINGKEIVRLKIQTA